MRLTSYYIIYAKTLIITKDIVDEIKKVEDHVDLLVNNAGVTTVRAQIDAEDNSPEAISKRMFEQNFDDWLKPYAINTASIYFSTGESSSRKVIFNIVH